MTYRDFYTAVINGEVTDEMKVFATEAIAKLDARNASRKDKPSKRAIENEPIKAKIAGVLGEEPKTASEIGVLVGVSTQKASALLRQMEVGCVDLKVKGKGVVKGYTL